MKICKICIIKGTKVAILDYDICQIIIVVFKRNYIWHLSSKPCEKLIYGGLLAHRKFWYDLIWSKYRASNTDTKPILILLAYKYSLYRYISVSWFMGWLIIWNFEHILMTIKTLWFTVILTTFHNNNPIKYKVFMHSETVFCFVFLRPRM